MHAVDKVWSPSAQHWNNILWHWYLTLPIVDRFWLQFTIVACLWSKFKLWRQPLHEVPCSVVIFCHFKSAAQCSVINSIICLSGWRDWIMELWNRCAFVSIDHGLEAFYIALGHVNLIWHYYYYYQPLPPHYFDLANLYRVNFKFAVLITHRCLHGVTPQYSTDGICLFFDILSWHAMRFLSRKQLFVKQIRLSTVIESYLLLHLVFETVYLLMSLLFHCFTLRLICSNFSFPQLKCFFMFFFLKKWTL